MATESLAIKYRPHNWDDVTEQGSTKIILQQQLSSNEVKHAYLFCGPAGCGKAQPLDSKVLTVNGYVEMKDIHVGDTVFTRLGEKASVVGVYPQGDKDVYEITLNDKTKIRVADTHLNNVYVYNQDKKCRQDFVLSTTELIDFVKTSRWKVRIDTPKVDWDYQHIMIEPYLLGSLIGDGSLLDNFRFSNSEQDVLDKVNLILTEQYGMHLVHQSNYDYRISYIEKPNHSGSRGDRGLHPLVRNYDVLTTLKGQLDYYGLLCKSVDKHIPTEYLINTEEVRIKLLQGLFDTDGYTDKNGVTYFSTSSKQLSDDFEFLVRSLGIRDTVGQSKSKYKTKNGNIVECSMHYTHYLHIPDDFPYCSSVKHLSRRKNRQNTQIRNIESIKYVGIEKCQCIMVDNDDHTYISDSFIPTHNTTCARIFANEINKGEGNPIELDAASNNSVDDIRRISQQAQTKSINSEYKIFILDEVHALSNSAWQAMLKLIEEPPAKSIFIFATTDPQKIPKTILSRVQRYDFKRISQQGIVNRLKHILREEIISYEYNSGFKSDIKFDTDALDYISKLADGHLRDAITLTDKCLSFSSDLTIENVVKALGTIDYDIMIKLTDRIIENNSKEVIQTIEALYNDGKELKTFIKQYIQFVLDIGKFGIGCDWKYITIPKLGQYETFLNDFGDYEFERCSQLLDKLIKLNADIKYSQTVKYDVEAMFFVFMKDKEI